MPDPIIIIGGGIAGMAAAWRLIPTGLPVTLLEARPRLGGRLDSLRAAGAPTPFDNGPHLFLSSYVRTRRLLREIGLERDFDYPWPGRLPVIGPQGRAAILWEWPLPAPFNFSAGLLSFPLLSWKARNRAVLAARDLLTGPLEAEVSAAQWLEAHGEAEERGLFWEPLVRAALNAPSEAVPVRDLQVILREGFAKGLTGGRLGHARRPLGKIFGEGMRRALEEAGVQVLTGHTVGGAEITAGRITSVKLRNGRSLPCRAVVAALPPWALYDWLRTLPHPTPLVAPLHLEAWGAQSLVSLFLWAGQRPWVEPWTSLPGRRAAWVFDYTRLWGDSRAPLGLILEWPDLPQSQTAAAMRGFVAREILPELAAALPQLSRVPWRAWKLVRERRATPLRPRALWGHPLSPTTALPNLVLAGDWLDPLLPPTVEAAVRSGEAAGEKIIMQKIALDK